MARPRKAAAKTNKSEFIPSRSNLKPAQIVEEGEQAGLSLRIAYVYDIRKAEKRAAVRAEKLGIKRPTRKARTTKTSPSRVAAFTGQEQAFIRLVAEIGIERSQAIISEVEARMMTFIRNL